MLVFKSTSLRYILTCWVLFFTLNKTIIKQVTCECCRKIRKYISVPDDTPQATSATPPPLLEHTRSTRTLVLCAPGAPTIAVTLATSRLTVSNLPGAGWEQVSIALEEVTCLLWSGPAWPFLTSGWLVWAGSGEQSQWALMLWDWNLLWPSIIQVLYSRGWPKGPGQEGT